VRDFTEQKDNPDGDKLFTKNISAKELVLKI
jgi:hypothetical protein